MCCHGLAQVSSAYRKPNNQNGRKITCETERGRKRNTFLSPIFLFFLPRRSSPFFPTQQWLFQVAAFLSSIGETWASPALPLPLQFASWFRKLSYDSKVAFEILFLRNIEVTNRRLFVLPKIMIKALIPPLETPMKHDQK